MKGAIMPPQPPAWDWLPGALIPFDWNAFFHKHRLLWQDHGGLRATLGPLTFRLLLYAIGQLGWLADEVFWPNWRQSRLSGPIFILGHQRSGTTLLHRLLSQDRTSARALSFQEMLLPATSIQRIIATIIELDRRCGGGLARMFRNWEERTFAPLDHIHRLRFGEIEEDEFVLWSIYASAMCVNDAPLATEHEGLNDLRHFHDWPILRQIRALGWYRACLLKKAGREPMAEANLAPWIVSKNPAFSQKIPQLRQLFPAACFIYLVRDPLETIPSRLSLIENIWRHRFPDFTRMNRRQIDVIVADSIQTYRAAEQDLPNVPAPQKIIVRYDELLADPARVVNTIYDHFGLPGPDPHLQARLAEQKPRPASPESGHRYSLADFDLAAADLLRELGPVLAAYHLR
jgi:hypothetical protein